MRPEPAARLAPLLVAALLAACAGAAPPGPRPDAVPAPAAASPAAPPPAAREPEERELLRRLAEMLAPEQGGAPDFPGAARELGAYLALHPGDRGLPALRSLAALLDGVERLDGELRIARTRTGVQAETILEQQRRLDQLAAAGAQDRAALERLAKENRELKAVVERLKALEMSMEEKRKKVR